MFKNAKAARGESPRKRRRKRSLITAGVIALAMCAAYIAYAVSLPEEEPFSTITPKVASDGSWALQDGVTEGGGESTSVAFSAAQVDSATYQNPVETIYSDFESNWTTACSALSQIADKKENITALSSSVALLDIVHADIVQYFEAFLNLASTSTGWGDMASDAVVNPLDGGEYVFSKTLDKHSKLTGKVNPQSGAIYIAREREDAIEGYVEVVRDGSTCYVQIFENSGPYVGVIRFLIKDDEFRCSRAQEITFEGLAQFYGKTPKDWQEFSDDAKRVFVYENETVMISGNEYK